jgi:glycerol-3-phosphate dehydrogenase
MQQRVKVEKCKLPDAAFGGSGCWSCACRQVAADALQRLHEQQVLLEQSRRQRWEAALASWRTLRSKHAIACFCEHVTADLSEPPARLDAFAQLRAAQEDAHVQLQQLCKRVGQLLPPHLSADAVQAWVAAAQQWNQGWQQQLDKRLQQLQQQEDKVEQQVRL